MAGKVDTWDFQWTFAQLCRNGLAAVSAVNLVGNIGFGPDATHTTDGESRWSRLPVSANPLPLRHPGAVCADAEYDNALLETKGMLKESRGGLFQRAARIPRRVARRLGKGLNARRRKTRIPGGIPRIQIERCWCGGRLDRLAGLALYRICRECGTYASANPPDPSCLTQVYSLQSFWLRGPASRGVPDITERNRRYLIDGRAMFWLGTVERFAPTAARVLEVGCAPGILLQMLKYRGCECVGVELTQEVARLVGDRTGCKVIAGEFPDLDAPSCDLFLAMDVLEHSYRPEAFVRKIAEVLDPGGVAILQSPIVRGGEGRDPNRPFGDASGHFLQPDEHVYILSSSAVAKLASTAGLRVIDETRRWRPGHEIVVLGKPS